MYLTALPCDTHNYSKKRCLVWSIPGPMFMYWVVKGVVDLSYLYIPLPIGVLFLVFFWLKLPSDGSYPKFHMLLVILGVVSGLMWTKVMVEILIDILETLGVILNLTEAFLGLTVLAIGNALPDALTTISLVKSGAGTMAISGGYAGQLFGFLVGFGISMLKLTLKSGSQDFDIFNMKNISENILTLIVLGVALLALILTFLKGVTDQYRMTKGFATIMSILYGVFVIACTTFAIRNAIKNP